MTEEMIEEMIEENDFTPSPCYEDGSVKHFCSFCGRDNRSVEVLVAGSSANICDECVVVCQEVIDERRVADRPAL